MKKVLSIILCITVLAAMPMTDIQASTAVDGDYEYSVEDGKATIKNITL